MAETIRFDTYDILKDGAAGIYNIGATADNKQGVIPEIAAAFGHTLTAKPTPDNLAALVGKVGSAKELQRNIPTVQKVLGTTEDALTIARGWVERSGLMVPVDRSFLTPETIDENPVEAVLMSGGVRNWMMRRAQIIKNLDIETIFLFSSDRVMSEAEGEDVKAGMHEREYMGKVIVPLLSHDNTYVSHIYTKMTDGDSVASKGAHVTDLILGLNPAKYGIVVASNAGAWLQNAGQIRRGFRALNPQFDKNGQQLHVVTDEFKLGKTGEEPTATHQNPLSALGLVVRSALEIAKQSETLPR